MPFTLIIIYLNLAKYFINMRVPYFKVFKVFITYIMLYKLLYAFTSCFINFFNIVYKIITLV
jgi:hypothetical protein